VVVVAIDVEEVPGRPGEVVDRAHALGPRVDHDLVAAAPADPGHGGRVERGAGVEPREQRRRDLFAFPHDHVVDRSVPHGELCEAGEVLAAADDDQLGTCGADLLDELAQRRPVEAEHVADAEDPRRRIETGEDLLVGEAEAHEPSGRDGLIRRLGDRVQHRAVVARRPERRTYASPQRLRRPGVLEVTRRDERGRVEQLNAHR
jgi:hypothetical protein